MTCRTTDHRESLLLLQGYLLLLLYIPIHHYLIMFTQPEYSYDPSYKLLPNNGSSDYKTIFGSPREIGLVDPDDIVDLTTNRYLTDNVIRQVLYRLKPDFPAPDVVVLDPAFLNHFELYASDEKSVLAESVPLLPHPSLRLVVMPFCLGNNFHGHWVTVVVDFNAATYSVLDSLGGFSAHKRITSVLMQLLPHWPRPHRAWAPLITRCSR